MLYPIMETVGVDLFYNPYGLIPFGSRARTKHPFKHMCLMEIVGTNGLAPLSCVGTQLVVM